MNDTKPRAHPVLRTARVVVWTALAGFVAAGAGVCWSAPPEDPVVPLGDELCMFAAPGTVAAGGAWRDGDYLLACVRDGRPDVIVRLRLD
jgi:hypothetical protein